MALLSSMHMRIVYSLTKPGLSVGAVSNLAVYEE